MALGLTDRFGSSVTFDESTRQVTFNLNDLSSIVVSGVDVGLDSSGMTQANKDDYADRILWALIQLNQSNQPIDNNDETVGVYITNQGKRSVNRNSVSQFGYQLVATGYVNDNLGITLDPDDIGA